MNLLLLLHSAFRVRRFAMGWAIAVSFLAVAPAVAQPALGGAVGASALPALIDSPALGVHDRAGLFRVETVVKVRAEIQEFRRAYHHDLFIESFPRVPDADLKRVKSLNSKAQEQYFAAWSAKRAEQINLDGVYVLICKEPRHVHVLVHPPTPEQAFSARNGEELRNRLEKQLARTPDNALVEAVAFVRQTVRENLAEREAAAKSIPVGAILVLVAVGVGCWLLLSLTRALLSRRTPQPSEETRVGLVAGFFAAMFGTTAGHWVYDHLFRAQPPVAPRPESEFLHTPPTPAEVKAEADTDEQQQSPTY